MEWDMESWGKFRTKVGWWTVSKIFDLFHELIVDNDKENSWVTVIELFSWSLTNKEHY